jgi:2-oxo-4-hydroxy-4-carboxy--5-ureidoimidazoline (OHCU) decarboxylase
VRELPRKLNADELAELFEGRTVLADRLAQIDNPLERAGDVVRTLSEEQKVEALSAHPAIGQRAGVSTRSASEQGSDDDPGVVAELERLNRAYEKRFGFRFVVFVAGRRRREIVPVLRQRLERTRDEELETGLEELVAIAVDRWLKR